jgi:lipoprotein-anchoring transpeptidase ErfK/SrfK
MWVRGTARHGRWLAVSTALRRGARPQWIRSSSRDLVLGRTRYSLRVVLPERRLEFREGRRVVRAMTVAVGRAATSTPTGSFAVTDNLKGESFGSQYGCCVIAITARQPNLPPGWIGDDRVAIHGTPGGGTGAGSTGCVHLAASDLRWLARRVRLGMPVFVEGLPRRARPRN